MAAIRVASLKALGGSVNFSVRATLYAFCTSLNRSTRVLSRLQPY